MKKAKYKYHKKVLCYIPSQLIITLNCYFCFTPFEDVSKKYTNLEVGISAN